MKKLARILLTPFLGLALSLAPAGVASASHEVGHVDSTNANSICEGVGLIDGNSACNAGDPNTGVQGIIKTAINIISTVVGVIAVIMIIVGGLKYIMSSGDSNNITSAKNTILFALVGLIVVAFAQVIVRFVLTKTTGTT